MAKLPRFLLCENPMSEPGAEYILHTQEPRFLVRRIYDNPLSSFEIVAEIDNIAHFFQNDATRMAKLMSRLGDWYVSYLRWKDRNEK